MSAVKNVVSTALAVIVRPDLWGALIALMLRLIPDQWWRRGPFPSRAYLAYRGQAVYGMPLTQIPPDDFIRYLQWCKAFPGPIT